jgi:hypothetical protein
VAITANWYLTEMVRFRIANQLNILVSFVLLNEKVVGQKLFQRMLEWKRERGDRKTQGKRDGKRERELTIVWTKEERVRELTIASTKGEVKGCSTISPPAT